MAIRSLAQTGTRVSLFVFAGQPTTRTNRLSSHRAFFGHTRAERKDDVVLNTQFTEYFTGIYGVPRFQAQAGACAVGVYQALLPM